MKKLLIAGTIVSLAALTLATTIGHDYLLEGFASNDIILQAVRIALIGLLAALLLSSPPRSIQFRTILGVVSAALGFGVAFMLERYTLGFLDFAMFVEVAIIFALESVESTAVENTVSTKDSAAYRTQNEKVLI